VGGLGGGCGGEALSLASCRSADAAWGCAVMLGWTGGEWWRLLGLGVAVDARSGGGGVSPSAAQRPPESLYLTL
jgi:hypothetical protein